MTSPLETLIKEIEKATGITVTDIVLSPLHEGGKGQFAISMKAVTAPVEKTIKVFPWEAK